MCIIANFNAMVAWARQTSHLYLNLEHLRCTLAVTIAKVKSCLLHHTPPELPSTCSSFLAPQKNQRSHGAKSADNWIHDYFIMELLTGESVT